MASPRGPESKSCGPSVGRSTVNIREHTGTQSEQTNASPGRNFSEQRVGIYSEDRLAMWPADRYLGSRPDLVKLTDFSISVQWYLKLRFTEIHEQQTAVPWTGDSSANEAEKFR